MALPILWHDKEGEHVIKAGTPLAQMFLVPKEVKQMKHTNTNTTEDNEARKQMNLTGLNMRVKFKQDYPMARMYRDSRVGTIGGGTSEIMRDIIAKIIIDGKDYEAEKSKI